VRRMRCRQRVHVIVMSAVAAVLVVLLREQPERRLDEPLVRRLIRRQRVQVKWPRVVMGVVAAGAAYKAEAV
jgi:hypothetical protein